jgi:hypothetical protein
MLFQGASPSQFPFGLPEIIGRESKSPRRGIKGKIKGSQKTAPTPITLSAKRNPKNKPHLMTRVRKEEKLALLAW